MTRTTTRAMRGSALAAGLLSVGILFSGCGATTKTWADGMGKVCKKYDKQMKSAMSAMQNVSDISSVGSAVAKVHDVDSKAVAAFHKVKAPSNSDIKKYLKLQDSALKSLGDLESAAKSGDMSKFSSIGSKFQGYETDGKKLEKKLGLKACANAG
jgi:hypothetical protein